MKTSHKSDELKKKRGCPQIGYLWNDTREHEEIRQEVIDTLSANKQFYSQLIGFKIYYFKSFIPGGYTLLGLCGLV